jgi:hypothetical protein
MKTMFRLALALGLLFGLAGPALAQNTNVPVRPKDDLYAEGVGIGYIDANGRLVLIGPNTPLPGSTGVKSTSTTTSGSVTTANAYQSALAASSTRNGCLIQNTSVNTLLVFLGAPGSATSGTSFQIAAGGTFSCRSPGGLVATDQISVTSSVQGSTFVVAAQ